MSEFLKRIKRRVLGGIEMKFTPLARNPRSDDIYLVSFPRSGNTWASFLVANVINEYLNLNMQVNFYNLHFFVPDVSFSKDIPENLQFPPFRRIIKSHYGFSPYYKNVILLIRDPRDVMVSYYHYRRNLNQFPGDLSSFVKNRKYGIRTWVRHTESWLNKSYPGQGLQLFFYEDFRQNPEKELERLFKLMGFNLGAEIIKKSAEKASFENMRKSEKDTLSYSIKKFEKFKFVRRGKNEQGKKELKDKDVEFIKRIAGDTMAKLGYK